MNTKRLLLAFVAVFVFIFFFEWLFHGVLLRGLYAATAGLWRTEQEMSARFGWLVFGQAVMAFMFCLLLVKTGSGTNAGDGLVFGALVGILFAGPSLVQYAVAPLPITLIGLWIAGGMIELAMAGALAGAIYRSRASTRQANASAT